MTYYLYGCVYKIFSEKYFFIHGEYYAYIAESLRYIICIPIDACHFIISVVIYSLIMNILTYYLNISTYYLKH